MTVRFLMPLLLSACSCLGQAAAGMSARVAADLEEHYKYSPPIPAVALENGRDVPVPESPAEDESIVRLEPFTVTAFNSFRDDVAEAARRAASAKEAAKFSPLKGGLILARQLGSVELSLGVWPTLIPYVADSPARQGLRLSVDVLRISW